MIDSLNQHIAKHAHTLDEHGHVLHSGANTGVFSNCSHSFWSIVELMNQGHVAKTLSFKNAFRNFKDENTQRDIYPDLFQTDSQQVARLVALSDQKRRNRCPDHHGVYKIFPYAELNQIMLAYFQPADSVLKIFDSIQTKYEIDFTSTLAVCYRGTDKATEVALAKPEDYVAAVNDLKLQGQRVLVQTDQEQVRQYFLSEIEDSFSIDEMPTTAGTRVIHQLETSELGLSKVEFAQQLLAVTYLLSQCDRIVNHTGNMAAWICLLRGNANGVEQFDRYGARVRPFQIIRGLLKNEYRKIRRVLKSENACYT